jgi:hypothetical protein
MSLELGNNSSYLDQQSRPNQACDLCRRRKSELVRILHPRIALKDREVNSQMYVLSQPFVIS